MTAPHDERLARAYGDLLARRAASGAPLPATLEEIALLARTGADTPERAALLDRVLADPRTRDEYGLLRDLAAQGMDTPGRHVPAPARRWGLAAAAVATLLLGVGLLSRVARVAGPDPVRGEPGAPALALVSPRAGAPFDPAQPFVWRAVPGALGYELEVVAESGDVLASVATADTTATAGTALDAVRASNARWMVTARLAAGGVVRSEARPLAP